MDQAAQMLRKSVQGERHGDRTKTDGHHEESIAVMACSPPGIGAEEQEEELAQPQDQQSLPAMFLEEREPSRQGEEEDGGGRPNADAQNGELPSDALPDPEIAVRP